MMGGVLSVAMFMAWRQVASTLCGWKSPYFLLLISLFLLIKFIENGINKAETVSEHVKYGLQNREQNNFQFFSHINDKIPPLTINKRLG